MRKKFTRFLCALALGAVGVMQSWGASDSQGNFIYIIGDINGWPTPIKVFSGQFEDYKMYETSPGSNVYARHFDDLSKYGGDKAWFRFHTDLIDPTNESEEANPWNYNVIGPMIDSYMLTRDSFTGILTADKAKSYRVISAMAPGAWCVDNMSGTLVVDLNRETVSMFDETERFIIMEGDNLPTIETFQNSRGAVGSFYMEPGDFSFELYAPLNPEHWLRPSGSSEISGENGFADFISYIDDTTSSRGESFKVTGWKGGVFDLALKEGGYSTPVYYLTLDVNEGRPLEDALFLFTPDDQMRPWSGCDNVVSKYCSKLSKDGDGNYTGVIDVRKLSQGFNICVEPGAKNQPAKTVIAPLTDGNLELVLADNEAFSSGELKPGANAAYWTLPDELIKRGGNITMTVTTGSKPSIKIDAKVEPYVNSGIYLRGDMNFWNAPEEWEFVTTGVAETWILLDKYIEAETQFKVADKNWGEINLGASDYEERVITPNFVYQLSSNSMSNLLLEEDFYGDIILRRSGSEYTLELQQPGQGMILAPAPETGLFMYDSYREKVESMTLNTKTGMYQNQVYVAPGKSVDLHIFTRKLPITPVEPGWETSYALQAAGNVPYTFELDEMGVGETDFIVREEMTTDKMTAPLTIYNDDSGTPYFTVNVDMEARKIYIERTGENAYLCGELSGGKVPNLRNRQEFKDLRVYFAGSIIDLPAGDVRFDIAASLSDGDIIPYNTVFETTPDESGITQFFTDDFNRCLRPVCIKGWKGGKVLMDFTSMTDLRRCLYVEVAKHCKKDGEPYYVFCQMLQSENPDSGIYKGRVQYDEGTTDKRFVLELKMFEESIYLGLPQYKGGIGSNFNKDREKLIDKNGHISVPVGKAYGSFYYSLPTMTGACEFDMTVDLGKGEISIDIVSGETATVYEVVADEESGIDGIIAYPSQSQENTVTMEGNLTGGSEVDFNFTTPEGTTVMPASGQDMDITFDETGFWSGDIAMSGNPAGSRKVARKQAENSSKWHITLPDGMENSRLSMKLDNENNRLTIQSSAHNKGFFIINDLDNFTLDDMESLRQSMLVEGSTPGVYEGVIHLDNAGSENGALVGFTSGTFSWTMSSPGISLPMYDYMMYKIDLLSEGASCQRMAWSRNETGNTVNAGIWNVKTISKDVNVRFDSNANTISFAIDAAGVENVAADLAPEESLRVIPGQGNVTVVSAASMTLTVYSVSGMAVKTVCLHPGTTVIDLPAGYYIAAGHKLLVR